MITQQVVRERFDYQEGQLVYRYTVHSRGVKGQVAGSRHHTGYYYVKVNNERYPLHHIIWLYHKGQMPVHEIDHVDNDKGNNRIENLRDVPHSVNQHNRRDTKENGIWSPDYYKRRGLPVPPEVYKAKRERTKANKARQGE